MIKVDVSGFEEFEKYLNRMADGFETFLRKFLLKEALRVLRDTKRNTPVDSGYLRNSWEVGNGKTYVICGLKRRRVEIKRHKKGERKNKKYRTQYLKTSRIDKLHSKAPTLESVRKVNKDLIVEIFNPVEYASYVEYGHETRGRNGWVPGYHMCKMAIDDVVAKMPRHYNMEFKRWLQALEQG